MVLSIFASIIVVAVITTTLAQSQGNVCPEKPADIVFVLDESSSIWPVDFVKLHPFLGALADRFDIGPEATRMAAISFSDKVTHRFGLSDYKEAESLKKAFDRIDQKTGGTRTDLALEYVRHTILREQRRGVPKVVVLITDGASWYPDRTSHEAQLLRNDNVTIFVVAISNKVNWAEIESIASKPEENHVFGIASFDDLGEALVDRLVDFTCVINTQPSPGVCSITDIADITFVLGCVSQNPTGAVKSLEMIHHVIADNNTHVGESQMRFGLVPEQCDLNWGFHLNEFYEKPDMLNYLERRKRRPSPADHIDFMVTQSFTERNGDRDGVRNIAVIIMDRASEVPEATVAAAERAKAAGIEIIAVSVGKDVSDEEVGLIASDPVDTYKITLSDYTEVDSLKEKFYKLICP